MFLFIADGKWGRWKWCISIHPMFLFIVNSDKRFTIRTLFQYIPCFYLSLFKVVRWTAQLKFQYIPCFYLSHLDKAQYNVFQYISCFYLSSRMGSSEILQTVFQYISCFYLSIPLRHICHIQQIFQYISCFYLSAITKKVFKWRYYFNTSHVSIYHVRSGYMYNISEFQYISCFYLSSRKSADNKTTY